jgi:hypothetical protein
VIDPCPSQSIIANGAHTTRETVARTISRLSTMKIVSRSGKAIFIDDQRRLEAAAFQF